MVPELTSIMVIYHVFINLWSTSFVVGPLCTGLISAWLSLAISRQKCNVLLDTMTKLLPHLAILSPCGASIWCSCSLSSSLLNDSFSAYAMHFGSTWYGFATFDL